MAISFRKLGWGLGVKIGPSAKQRLDGVTPVKPVAFLQEPALVFRVIQKPKLGDGEDVRLQFSRNIWRSKYLALKLLSAKLCPVLTNCPGSGAFGNESRGRPAKEGGAFVLRFLRPRRCLLWVFLRQRHPARYKSGVQSEKGGNGFGGIARHI